MLIRTERISKRFPIGSSLLGSPTDYVHAVDNVDLTIERGRTLALVGESGSGKTTLGRICAGLLEATEGSVYFRDLELTGLSKSAKRKLRSDLQFIFQDPFSSLNPRQNIRTILGRPFDIHTDLSKKEIDREVKALLESVHLAPPEPLMDRYPHQFSGGQRQRIVFARAIALRPEFVVADEPVSSLDMSVKAQLLSLLKRFQEELGLTYLFITHELSVVRSIARDIAVMYLGRIVETAPVTDLFEGPLHPYTEGLLAATPKLDPDKKDSGRDSLIPTGDKMPSPINPPSGCHFRTRCLYAQPICKEKVPSLRAFGERQVRCHFVGDDRFPLTQNLSQKLRSKPGAEPYPVSAEKALLPRSR